MNAITTSAPSAAPVIQSGAKQRTLRQHYLILLGWAFTLFNTVRVVAYLPTVLAIAQSGDSSQHSLWTWFTWAGANATMSAWLYENQDRHFSRAAVVSAGNAAMCALTLVVILAYRF
jgi:hypothetical protein